MDDDLIARLNAAGADLQRRATELDQSGQEHDIAFLMQGLAVAMEAIGSLAETVKRLDGPVGLGRSGD